MSDIDDVVTKLGYIEQSLDALTERLPTREERQAEEERRAWDGYYTMAQSTLPDERAVSEATRMLKERRKRFGAGKEAADVRRVSVPLGVLLEAADLLQKGGPPVNCEAVANVLRALVSE